MYIRTSEKGYYIVNKVMEEIGNYTEDNIAEFTKKCNLMHEDKNNLKVLLKGIQIKDELHSDHKNRVSHTNKKLINENNDLGYSPTKIKKTLLSQNNYDNKRKSIGKETYIQDNEEIENKSTELVPYALETSMTNHHATFITSPNWSDNVIVDNNLITGQNPASAARVGKTIADMLIEKYR